MTSDTCTDRLITAGDTAFMPQNGIIDYLAGPNEEIPDVEEYARLFLAARLKENISGHGLFLFGRKAAMLAPPESYQACETARVAGSLARVIPIPQHLPAKMLARRYDVVLNFGPQFMELCWFEGNSFEVRALSMTISRLASDLTAIFKTAPIKNLAAFFDQDLLLPDVGAPGTGATTADHQGAWKNLTLIQPVFQGLVAEIGVLLPNEHKSLCLIGELAGSGRFLRVFQNFLRLPVTPVADIKPVLQALGKEIAIFPPPLKLRIPSWLQAGLALALLLNLYLYQYFFGADLEALKGTESLHRSILAMQQAGGSPPVLGASEPRGPNDFRGTGGRGFVREDIAWMNRHLDERAISWTRLFNALETAKPDGVQLETIENQSRQTPLFHIGGTALSVERVQGFLANLQKVPGFREVFLSSYRLQGTHFRFLLSLEYHGSVPVAANSTATPRIASESGGTP